jgi:hypothetical protein
MFIMIERAAGSMMAPPSPCSPAREQQSVAARERASKRSSRDQAQAGHQDPATTEKIRRPATEQEEPAATSATSAGK